MPEVGTGDPADPWTGREFHVKWKRWSYVHCSWDTLSTLSQLGGFKRVTNYIKKADDLEAIRRYPLPLLCPRWAVLVSAHRGHWAGMGVLSQLGRVWLL